MSSTQTVVQTDVRSRVNLKLEESLFANAFPRGSCADIREPSHDQLFDFSLVRLLRVARHGTLAAVPSLFPQAIDTYFYPTVVESVTDVRTEYGRVLYMLAEFPERGLPKCCQPAIDALMAEPSVLTGWSKYVDRLTRDVEAVKVEAVTTMKSSAAPIEPGLPKKEDLWRDPAIYETSSDSARLLWLRVTREAARCLINNKRINVRSFLQIYAFIKDPVGALQPSKYAHLTRSADTFLDLWKSIQYYFEVNNVPRTATPFHERLSAQLALEASYLALANTQKVAHLRIEHERQLNYVYVSIDRLPRAEFSRPSRVTEVLTEIVESTAAHGKCAVAPIAVAYTAPLTHEDELMEVIIDGNNRTTSLALLRFLATQEPHTLSDEALERYCTVHGLGMKWRIDLRDALSHVTSHAKFERLRGLWDVVKTFADVDQIPALLVQEEDFFTMCMRRGTREKAVLLQPMHQTLYNDDKAGCVAFRAKAGQAHGKSKGFPILDVR